MHLRLKSLAITLLNIYQKYIRSMLPCACRFYPSCSEYAKQAIEKYGLWHGGLKASARLLRCHPWSAQSGHDPLL